jgi:hypothetical protein
VNRADALASLAAALREAELHAAHDVNEKDDPQDARELHDFMAERLVRFAPAEGLSIRLDDGSEFPS